MLALALALTSVLAFVAWKDALPLLDRLVRVAERRFPILEELSRDTPDGRLPPDIESLAQGESEEWARDAVRERAWELFRSTKNWDEAKRILYTERQITLFGGDLDRGVN